jgi:hypothetical protein
MSGALTPSPERILTLCPGCLSRQDKPHFQPASLKQFFFFKKKKKNTVSIWVSHKILPKTNSAIWGKILIKTDLTFWNVFIHILEDVRTAQRKMILQSSFADI